MSGFTEYVLMRPTPKRVVTARSDVERRSSSLDDDTLALLVDSAFEEAEGIVRTQLHRVLPPHVPAIWPLDADAWLRHMYALVPTIIAGKVLAAGNRAAAERFIDTIRDIEREIAMPVFYALAHDNALHGTETK